MGSRRECICVVPNPLHFAHPSMGLVMDWSMLGLVILFKSFALMLSRWKCPLSRCSSHASWTVSSFVTHYSLALALSDPSPTLHNFPSSIMYSFALCLALFCTRRLFPWSSSRIESMTSMNMFSLVKRVRRVLYVDSEWLVWTTRMSLTSLVRASQSSLTVHSCPSPCSIGALTNFRLSPSATTLSLLGRWRMSTMLWARTASLHLAWVELRVELRRWLRRAWQSVSSSTG